MNEWARVAAYIDILIWSWQHTRSSSLSCNQPLVCGGVFHTARSSHFDLHLGLRLQRQENKTKITGQNSCQPFPGTNFTNTKFWTKCSTPPYVILQSRPGFLCLKVVQGWFWCLTVWLLVQKVLSTVVMVSSNILVLCVAHEPCTTTTNLKSSRSNCSLCWSFLIRNSQVCSMYVRRQPSQPECL